MLKKRSDGFNDDGPNDNPIAEDKVSPPPPSHSSVSTKEKTVIGQHILVEGVVRGNENLVIEGSMKGSIELEKYQVTVGANGQVEAEIRADNVTISGRLVGNIQADGKVEITKEADFSGEIKAKRIAVEDGAFLKAAIELERQSDKKDVPAAKSFGQAPSGAQKPGQGGSGLQKQPVNTPLDSAKGN